MKKMGNWIDYYNAKSRDADNYLEISDMYLDNDLATNDFLKSEKTRMYEMLQPQKSFTLLDLGCCAGVSLGLLKEYYSKTIGVDLAEGPLKIAKARLPDSVFIQDDITNPKILGTNMAENVISYGVLHYISPLENNLHLEGFINTIFKVIKPGGRALIMRVPNNDYYEPYQKYRMDRNNNRKPQESGQLKWNWVSPTLIKKLCIGKFEYIPILPTTGIDFPFKGFFDFILIKK